MPEVTANNFAASLISRIMNPVDISITELITSFRLTTSQDDDEFYMIEDIRYDYLVVGEWSNIEVDVYVLESDYYKMEVRSDVLASPWPPWDWQARVIENVYLYANQRNTITLRVKPDTETGEIAGLVISKRWTNYLGYCMESQIHTNLILFQRFLTEIPQEFLVTNAGTNPDTNIDDVIFSEEMAEFSFSNGTVIVQGSMSGIHDVSMQYDEVSSETCSRSDNEFFE